MKAKIKAFWMIIVVALIGGWLWKGDSFMGGEFKKDFVFGLDLAGGAALVYTIDTKSLPAEVNVNESVEALRDVVERRVNLFGVREPSVTTQYSRLQQEWRLVIELPGVTNVEEAAKLIGETPVLEFRTEKPGSAPLTASSSMFELIQNYEPSALTGSYLKRAALMFDPTTNKPMVELTFNEEGAKLLLRFSSLWLIEMVIE